MKTSINSNDLKAAVASLDIIPTHNAIPSSQFVKVEGTAKGTGVSMLLTGLASVSVNLPAVGDSSPWGFYIDRRVLAAFAAAAAKDTTITIAKDKVILQSAHRRLQIATISKIGGYCTWAEDLCVGDPTHLSVKTRAAVSIASEYAPQTAAADHLSCVYLVEAWGVVSTDQHTIIFHKDKTLKGSHPLPLLLSAAMRDGTLTIDPSGALVEFTHKEQTQVVTRVYQSVSDRCAKDFPIAAVRQQTLKALKAPAICRISATALAESLQILRSFVFGNDDATVVTLEGAAGETSLRLQVGAVQGDMRERLTVLEPLADAVQLKWVATRVLPWLGALGTSAEVEVGFKDHVNILRTADKRSALLQAEVN